MQWQTDTRFPGFHPNLEDWIPKDSKKKNRIYTSIIVLQAVIDVLWLSLLHDEKEDDILCPRR